MLSEKSLIREECVRVCVCGGGRGGGGKRGGRGETREWEVGGREGENKMNSKVNAHESSTHCFSP